MSGMGVFAKRDFKEGEVVVRSSHALAKITPEVALKKYKDIIESVVSEKIEANKNIASLALYLLLEKEAGDSDITPYLDSLPTDLSHLPLFWTEEELKELQGSSLITTVYVYRQLSKMIYEECVCKLKEKHEKLLKTTQDDVSHTLAIITSRSWNHKTLGFELRPVLDFFNMTINGTVPSYNENGEWTLTAPKEGFAKGKEIFVSYGVKPHSDMLYSYGVHNPSFKECEQVKVIVNVTNPASIVKFATEHAPDSWSTVVFGKENVESLLLLSRILSFKHSDIADVKRLAAGSVLNADNEKRALEHSIGLLKFLVESKGTTLEEDKEKLTTISQIESPRLWTAISVRRFEKEVILACKKWLEDTLASMEKTA